MSAKSAKQHRKMLSPHRFPLITQKELDSFKKGTTGSGSEVAIDHNRRIQRLSKSQRISLAEAIEKHCKRIQLSPKPKT